MILYGFESYFIKAQKQVVTDGLTYESVHILISVNIANTLE